MASYFVASAAAPNGFQSVHDRSRCPPACFPQGALEYLGEYRTAAQALFVARLVYAAAAVCSCCDPLQPSAQQGAATSLRS